MKLSAFNCCLAVLLAGLLAGPVAAREPNERGTGMHDSVRRVERETGGKVLKAERVPREDREVYRVKVLTPEGRVRVMQDEPPRRESREGSRNESRRAPRDDR